MITFLKSKKVLLVMILLLAIFFRFNNLNWDENFHLHPDERFLTMVGNAMTIPSNVTQYLDPKISSLNPTNIGFPFFVYGIFPILINKIIAVLFENDNYNAFTIQGRFLSALFDVMTVLLVYKTAQLLVYRKISNFKSQISNFPLWSAFFYAAAVLPVQLSHFFAVDTFLNFFMFASFYCVLKFSASRAWRSFFLAGIFFSLALASKVTALYILPLNLFFLFAVKTRNKMEKVMLFLAYFFIIYIILRVANPYYFESNNFLNFVPNKVFVQNIQSLKSFEGNDIMYPPSIQWIDKNPTFSLINLAFFGVGLPYFIFIITGLAWIMSNIKYQISKQFQISNLKFQIILLWVLGFFVYQSFQFVKAMRYFIFLYPFIAMFAGLGVCWTVHVISTKRGTWRNPFISKRDSSTQVYPEPSRETRNDMKKIFLNVILILIVLLWPFAYSSIYLNKNSRVAASEWIYSNLPNGAVILSEHWDDALPLHVADTFSKQFIIHELPVFGVDDTTKWNEMNTFLSNADYYILSSNRGWGSIQGLPEKYPLMSKFYSDLFSNKLSYRKIAEFSSYPKLGISTPAGGWKLEVPDQWADESFTVYEHPKVMIFKNNGKNNF